jgi:feruloyl esterase
LKDQIQALSALIDVPTDWSKFLGHGGKLIYHSAATDYLTNPRGQAAMYEAVVKRYGQGKIDKSVRYYITPDANHGSMSVSATDGTPQARYMDIETYLENWVEKGTAPPDAIPQVLMDPKPPYTVQRSRPLCRYPKYPHYNGGDPDKMESYTCATP